MVEIWIKFRYHYKKRACSAQRGVHGCGSIWKWNWIIWCGAPPSAAGRSRRGAFPIMSWYMYFAVRATSAWAAGSLRSEQGILCAFVPAYCTVFPLRGSPAWSSTESISRCRRTWTAFRCPRLPKSNRPAGWSLCSNPCLRSTSKKHIFINGGKIFCSSRSYAKYSPHCMGKMLPQSLSVLKKCWSISMRTLPVRLRWKSLLPAPA